MERRHHISLALLAALLISAVMTPLPALAQRDRPSGNLELLGNARVNNRASSIVYRIDPRQNRLAEIRLRSGDLSVTLESLEIQFTDGSRQRVQLLDRIGPGEQSRPIEVDRRRTVREVSVTKRPGFRPGETSLQLLGLIDRGPAPGNWSGIGQRIPPGWIMFGAQEASFRTERDVIRIGQRFGIFDRIALRIMDNGIFLRELTIVYGNGERDRKVIETSIPADSQTRPIDLRGDRYIKEIEFVYRSERDNRKPAVLEVYGDLSEMWISGKSQYRPKDGWLMLGAERVSMFAKERNAIHVSRRIGRIKALRFAAHQSEVTFYSARVVYENGQAEDIPLVRKLKAGQETAPVKLKGNRRIDRIELRYRSKLGLRGEGIVEVWGLT